MTRMLVLGGTGWLGSEIARAAVTAGAEVTCLARGQSGPAPEGVTWVRADRRDPAAFDALTGDWDEIVEIAYDPEIVSVSLAALADRTAHWTLISTVSVYSDTATPHADETAEVVEPRDLAEYADAKVAAERATSARLADRLLIARPGLIVGAGDPSDRFGYWPGRLSRGGRVLTPTAADRFVQVIDVVDLAAWVVRAGAAGSTGVIDAIGDIHPMSDFFEMACEAAGFEGELVSMDDDALLAHEVKYWSGPRSLPLWLPADWRGFAQRDGSAYLAAGGTLSPLPETLRRTTDDERRRGLDRSRRAGLTLAEEAAILAS